MNEDKKSYIINEIDDKTKEEMNKEWKNTTKLIEKINSIDLDKEILEIKFKKEGKYYLFYFNGQIKYIDGNLFYS